MSSPQLILASRSPRRRQLLAQIGIAFEVADVEVDERVVAAEAPAAYVARLALSKAAAVEEQRKASAEQPPLPVLAADTAVVVGRRILGKPADHGEALEQLEALSGRTHRVFTGVALSGSATGVCVVTSRVSFRTLTHAERCAYCATGEPMDKAGSYGIQGLGAIFVTRLTGSYSAVMGLPLAETAALLAEVGVYVLAPPRARGET